MTYIYLPGYSLRNQTEQDSNCEEFAKAGIEMIKHHYLHWQDQTLSWNEAGEVAAVLAEIGDSQEVSIVGKSIGSYLAARLVAELGQKIKVLVLMGVPSKDLSADELEKYSHINEIYGKVTVIQNTQDPHGSAEEVQQLLSGLDLELISKEASHHDYFYPQEILQALHVL